MQMSAKEKMEFIASVEKEIADRIGIDLDDLRRKQTAIRESYDVLLAHLVDNGRGAEAALLKSRFGAQP